MHGSILQEHLDNIETQFDGWVLQKAQVIQGGAGQASTPFPIHSRGGPFPILGGAGLDLGENEAVRIPKNQVDFTAVRAEIGGEEFEAALSEIFFGSTLPQFAITQVQRQLAPMPPSPQALEQPQGQRLGLLCLQSEDVL